jgi:hypothetical protein
MNARCTLETEGFQVVFHLRNLDPHGDYVDGVIELCLRPELGDLSVESPPTFLALSDLRQLIAYLDAHIACLEEDPDTESPVFVPLELGFQVQALSGEVAGENDGEFTLRFMVNVGQREGCARTYVGAEGVVTVQSVREFGSSLDTVLAQMVSAK